MATSVPTAHASNVSNTGAFIHQQGGYFKNTASGNISTTAQFITLSSVTTGSRTDNIAVGYVSFQPVTNIKADGGVQWFYTFQQCRLDSFSLILFGPYSSGKTANLIDVLVAPWNKDIQNSNDLYTDPSYLPGCVYKQFTVDPDNVVGVDNRQMIRLTVENPTFFLEAKNPNDTRASQLAQSNFWPTLYPGGVLSEPEFQGIILKIVGTNNDLESLEFPITVQYNMTFEGIRMARGPSRAFPAEEMQLHSVTNAELNLDTGDGDKVIVDTIVPKKRRRQQDVGSKRKCKCDCTGCTAAKEKELKQNKYLKSSSSASTIDVNTFERIDIE